MIQRRDLLKFLPFAPLVEFLLRVFRCAERPEIVLTGSGSGRGKEASVPGVGVLWHEKYEPPKTATEASEIEWIPVVNADAGRVCGVVEYPNLLGYGQYFCFITKQRGEVVGLRTTAYVRHCLPWMEISNGEEYSMAIRASDIELVELRKCSLFVEFAADGDTAIIDVEKRFRLPPGTLRGEIDLREAIDET